MHVGKVELLNDKKRGHVWREWANRIVPADIYAEFRLMDSFDSHAWLNVVEHNIFVAAASLTLANLLKRSRVHINTDRVIRSAIVHDATKRIDVEDRKSRETELFDFAIAKILLRHGYDYGEVVSALNTGRSADRFITDRRVRKDYIVSKPLEANIIGYADARCYGSRIYSLAQAQVKNLEYKRRPDDSAFFTRYWLPYYRAVEQYLRSVAPDLKPAELTDDSIYLTVLKQTRDYFRQSR
jgi:hypothetical protein